jgi:UDP-N-acetylmuramate dehydrogenase
LSLNIQRQVLLTTRNSLRLPAYAEFLVEVNSDSEVLEALTYARQRRWPVTVLGGGSNCVLAQNITGLVICVRTRGIAIEGNRVEVAAGESWDLLVRQTLKVGLSGLENLTLIPGLVGAAPIQNIGAYGVELGTMIEQVHAIEIESGKALVLSNSECQFGYRDSIFKQSLRQVAVISRVCLRLSHDFSPRLDYPELRQWRELQSSDGVTATQVSEAVAEIRRKKLPDPSMIGNVGSFFKNPQVSLDTLRQLQNEFPTMPAREQEDGDWKLSAAWLIDSLGLKGFKVGQAAVSDQHALVLVNTGTATGEDIMALARQVQYRVMDRYNLQLEIEPVVYPSA